jgi:hypothetical protein
MSTKILVDGRCMGKPRRHEPPRIAFRATQA